MDGPWFANYTPLSIYRAFRSTLSPRRLAPLPQIPRFSPSRIRPETRLRPGAPSRIEELWGGITTGAGISGSAWDMRNRPAGSGPGTEGLHFPPDSSATSPSVGVSAWEPLRSPLRTEGLFSRAARRIRPGRGKWRGSFSHQPPGSVAPSELPYQASAVEGSFHLVPRGVLGGGHYQHPLIILDLEFPRE